MDIKISDAIKAACPDFCFAAIVCEVKNGVFDEDLWKDIQNFTQDFHSSHKMEDINKRKAIKGTREAYKKLGKDPNRYRPSAEALCRRIIKNNDLYQINVLVDLINLISLKTGYSIGGFDAEKIDGNIILGVGEANEKFEAIGRGLLNIEGLPVYRDGTGGIGTPTSDEERTKITIDTTLLLMIINAYSGKEGLQEAVNYSVDSLKKYASASQIEIING